VALFATIHAQSVTVYSDAQCTKKIQTVKFSSVDYYQCTDFTSTNAQGVIFSTKGFDDTKGWNVWDSQYCAGDMAGGYILTLPVFYPEIHS